MTTAQIGPHHAKVSVLWFAVSGESERQQIRLVDVGDKSKLDQVETGWFRWPCPRPRTVRNDRASPATRSRPVERPTSNPPHRTWPLQCPTPVLDLFRHSHLSHFEGDGVDTASDGVEWKLFYCCRHHGGWAHRKQVSWWMRTKLCYTGLFATGLRSLCSLLHSSVDCQLLQDANDKQHSLKTWLWALLFWCLDVSLMIEFLHERSVIASQQA